MDLQVPRTQEERWTATRAALLNATIACLVEDGYAGATVRRISERAGVTPGALQHHFATRTDLVIAATGSLSAQLTAEMLADGLPQVDSPRRLAEELLDRLWEVHTGPLMGALAELIVAARTDAVLRERLAALYDDTSEVSAAVAARLFRDAAVRPDFVAQLEIVLATLRGLALMWFVTPEAVDATWPNVRAQLLLLLFPGTATEAGS